MGDAVNALSKQETTRLSLLAECKGLGIAMPEKSKIGELRAQVKLAASKAALVATDNLSAPKAGAKRKRAA